MRRGSTFLAAAVFLVPLGGCTSSGGGQAAADRGIRVYERGQPVYVCRQAPIAPTLEELTEELRSGQAERDSPTGESVRIAERVHVEVNGSSTPVARVRAEERDSEYWIPFTALCSR